MTRGKPIPFTTREYVQKLVVEHRISQTRAAELAGIHRNSVAKFVQRRLGQR